MHPLAATGLSTNGIFGAVILQWDAQAYNGHNHTEVWRAQIDDRAQASLVHEANGSRYTDVTGNDYLVLKQGRIESYIYTARAGW